MIVTAYNHHVRLLSPERPWWALVAFKVYSAAAADIVMESIPLTDPLDGRIPGRSGGHVLCSAVCSHDFKAARTNAAGISNRVADARRRYSYLNGVTKKLPEVARLVGYESDAAFSKAFKRVVGASRPGEYLKRGYPKQEAMSEWQRYLNWTILTLAAGLGTHGRGFFQKIQRLGRGERGTAFARPQLRRREKVIALRLPTALRQRQEHQVGRFLSLFEERLRALPIQRTAWSGARAESGDLDRAHGYRKVRADISRADPVQGKRRSTSASAARWRPLLCEEPLEPQRRSQSARRTS